MKQATILALLGITQANRHRVENKEESSGLSSLITSALAGAPPGIINIPAHTDADVEDGE